MYVSRVKQLSEEHGLSKEELTDRTGYSPHTIKRWLINDPPIIRADARKVQRFMEVFGLSNWWEVFEPELYVSRTVRTPIKGTDKPV